MTIKKTNRALAVVAAIGFVATGAMSSANAATLDFVAAASGAERGVADGTVLNLDGLNVALSAGGSDFAYLDDLSGGLPGGLGVCSMLDGNAQCNPSSDDSISEKETVTLSFESAQTLSGHTFNDSTHNPVNLTDTLLLGLNGGPLAAISFGDAMAAVLGSVSSITFGYGGSSATNFYLSNVTATSPVPLPAGIVLLLSGLMGLGFLGRSRKSV